MQWGRAGAGTKRGSLCRLLLATAPTCDNSIWLPRGCRVCSGPPRAQLLPAPARRTPGPVPSPALTYATISQRLPSCTSTGFQGNPQSKFYGRSVCAKLLAAWALLLVDFAAVAGDEASVLRGPAPLGGVFQATPMSVDSINELSHSSRLIKSSCASR